MAKAIIAEAVGLEALGPIALIAGLGALLLLSGGAAGTPSTDFNWFLEGVTEGKVTRGNLIAVNVRHIGFPHDALRIMAATLSPGNVVDNSTYRQFGAGLEPIDSVIPTGYFGGAAGILVALEVLHSGSVVATGAPGEAGYDPRLSKSVLLV